jgi:hypothetical protein
MSAKERVRSADPASWPARPAITMPPLTSAKSPTAPTTDPPSPAFAFRSTASLASLSLSRDGGSGCLAGARRWRTTPGSNPSPSQCSVTPLAHEPGRLRLGLGLPGRGFGRGCAFRGAGQAVATVGLDGLAAAREPGERRADGRTGQARRVRDIARRQRPVARECRGHLRPGLASEPRCRPPDRGQAGPDRAGSPRGCGRRSAPSR